MKKGKMSGEWPTIIAHTFKMPPPRWEHSVISCKDKLALSIKKKNCKEKERQKNSIGSLSEKILP